MDTHCVVLGGRRCGLLRDVGAGGVEAALPAADALYGNCFAEIDARPAAPGAPRRLLQFQGFGGGLLAGVVYKLRYGSTFGFSGDCSTPTDGGFACSACTGEACGDRADAFAILWSGGESVAARQQGQRRAGGELRRRPGSLRRGVYVLKRVAPETCSE